MANKAWHHLYGRAWRKRRELHLAGEPLCRMCRADGRLVPATVADHITPHRGDPVLFRGPLQSLCAQCHNSRKQAEERADQAAAEEPSPCDLQGYPTDGSW